MGCLSYFTDLVFALNMSRHESTGFSPAFSNFGRELEPPAALSRPPVNEDNENRPPAETDYPGYLKHLQKLVEVYELVRVNLGRAFTAQSRNYNLRRQEWRCKVGDRVMKQVVKTQNPLSSADKGLAAKLAPKFSGPYVVKRVVSPIVYDLKDKGGKWYRHVHVKDLKPLGPAKVM